MEARWTASGISLCIESPLIGLFRYGCGWCPGALFGFASFIVNNRTARFRGALLVATAYAWL
jgi:hypothetical protein